MCAVCLVWLFFTLWTVAHQALCPWDLPARILDWVAISFSRGFSWPRDQTRTVSCTAGRCFTDWATNTLSHWLVCSQWWNFNYFLLVLGWPKSSDRKTQMNFLANPIILSSSVLSLLKFDTQVWTQHSYMYKNLTIGSQDNFLNTDILCFTVLHSDFFFTNWRSVTVLSQANLLMQCFQ